MHKGRRVFKLRFLVDLVGLELGCHFCNYAIGERHWKAWSRPEHIAEEMRECPTIDPTNRHLIRILVSPTCRPDALFEPWDDLFGLVRGGCIGRIGNALDSPWCAYQPSHGPTVAGIIDRVAGDAVREFCE